MLRTHSPVRALTVADTDEALRVCAQDATANVFVAARVLEGSLATQPGALLGYESERELTSLCWTAANLVPVECDQGAIQAFASKARRTRRQCSGVFGPAEQVLPLWAELAPSWGRARAVRPDQPLLAASTPPGRLGVDVDPEVRRATADEVDLLMPAAAAMFTEEIGVPPFHGSGTVYRQGLASLIAKGHTFVRIEEERVVFKADVGSAAQGVTQIQGVWVAPSRRGQGLAAPAMAAVVEIVLAEIAPMVTLYVNDFNAPARAAYARVGFRQIGTFATVLL